MASKSLTLQVQPRGKPIKKLPADTTLMPLDTTAELYKRLAAATGYSVHRLRITKGSDGSVIPNSKDVSIDKTGLRDQSTIRVKDLGPQIAWRTVFVIEYLGPLLIHPLFYFLRPYIYPSPSLSTSAIPPATPLQTLSMAMLALHFFKRELETLLVHRFSSSTMPARNIFKNSFHYWVLGGVLIAYFVYSDTSPISFEHTQESLYIDPVALIGTAMFVFGEMANLYTHLVLKGLRRPGTTERGIPQGFGFNWVTCPNYFFETVAWTGILLVTRSWATGLFIVVAVAQMWAWAKKKERRYRNEFGDRYMKKRFSMIPGLF